MAVDLYFPHDEIDIHNPNLDLAADYLELSAIFSDSNQALVSDLRNASEIGADEDYRDVDEEIETRDEIVSGAARRLEERQKALGNSYPFSLDHSSSILTFVGQDPNHGQASYLLSLVLSHLKSVSTILYGSVVYPTDTEVRELREYFQYFATAALAAEVRGQAWSFGYPRPDGSSFHSKLNEIWGVFQDGVVLQNPGAPAYPKDDQIDVFAARMHADGLPGFLLAAAQVATGANWRDKSIRSHLTSVFPKRWFGLQPVTDMVCYHLIPFARPDSDFIDDCRVLGNVLHRLRVPNRVAEAQELHAQGIAIEAFDRLDGAVRWLKDYTKRGLSDDANKGQP